MYEISFGKETEDIKRFALMYTAFTFGGDKVHRDGNGRPTEWSRDERANASRVIKALKSVSHVTKEEVDGGETRHLNAEGGVIRLDQKCYSMLQKFIEAAPLPTGMSDLVDDLLDWLDALKPVKKEEASK